MSTGTWPQAYYDWASGVMVADSGARRSIAPRAPVADPLNALPFDVRRVYLCGALPALFDQGRDYLGKRAIDSTLLWGATLPPESGWEENPEQRHYCNEEGARDTLTLHYRHHDSGRAVEIVSIARWVGDALALTATSDDGRWLFAWLKAALYDHFVAHSSAPWRRPPTLYNTPGTTGWALLDLMHQNAQREIPLLSEAEQALIRSILPQARIEHFAAPTAGATLPPGATYMDGRLMYAASMRGLGTGPLMCDAAPDIELFCPGFYRVRVRVPPDWPEGMPGILPVKVSARVSSGWRWPARAGEQAETWAGESELRAALWPHPHSCGDCAVGRSGKRGGNGCPTHGWYVQVLERALLTKPSTGPLDLWAKKLTDLYLHAKRQATTDGRSALAAAAIRSLLINTLGMFNTSPETRRLTRISTSGDVIPPRVHDLVSVQAADGNWVHRWTEPVPLNADEAARAARRVHPELCQQVWSRCRGRLLLAQVGSGEAGVMTGMLALPPHSVVAAQTDAMLMTHDPHWPDDGLPGRLRAKRVLRESAIWPEEWDDVEAVKARMEATV